MMAGAMKISPEAIQMINDIKSLESANAAIARTGCFFTETQIANEKLSWKMKMALRRDFGMELGTY